MENKSKRDEVVELVNKLFIYTDYHQWNKLLEEVLTESIWFDMSSLGAGEGKSVPAKDICAMWEKGFEGIDAVHHQAGNHLVRFASEPIEANVFCYAIALHYKKAATQGSIREFVGSYDLHCVLTDKGWRIDSFTYTVKYINGNADLK
ncbi:MAG TPA: nuclear transport factor 2 family protein [Ohtaekwangia sp.]|uniref:nuclear transport factor 2 family protein n=1 Tax=Ohtaekwangia sp. TaxID=2066019 RepID=UPI002F958C92